MEYSEAEAWSAGPDRVYGLLAAAAVDGIEDDLTGLVVLDAGAGTGAAGRVLARRGASVVSVDSSGSMVRRAHGARIVGDVLRLPLRTDAVAAAVAALVLSHVDDPTTALRELARVTQPGGPVCATAFPYGLSHPVKAAADRVLAAAGYRAPQWYTTLKTAGERRVGTPADLTTLAGAAGLREPVVRACEVPLARLGPDGLVAWRLGMAPVAAWLAGLGRPVRERIAAEVAAAVGEPEPLPLLVLVARSQ